MSTALPHIRVTAYVVNEAGERVGNPVHTVHPLSMPATIEERAPVDGLRVIYEITATATTCVGVNS